MRLGQRKTAEADSDPDRLRARRQGESRSVRLSLMSWETLIGLICLMGLSVLIGPEYEAKVEAPTREVTLHGHQSLVGEVAFAADGQTLLSCAYDGTVRLWEARRDSPDFGAEVGCLPHDSHVYAAAMSPDRKLIAAVGVGFLKLWDCETDRFVPSFEDRARGYRCLAFSPDGRTLALGGIDKSIRFLDVASRQERAVAWGHDQIVRSLAYSPDGTLLASISISGDLKFWDARTRKAVERLRTVEQPIYAMAFSPDGRTLALGGMGWTPRDVTLWDLATGQLQTRLSGHRQGITALAFSADGQTIASASSDQTVRLWHRGTGESRGLIRSESAWVKSLSFSPHGAWLGLGGQDRLIRLQDVTEALRTPEAALSRTEVKGTLAVSDRS